MIYMKKLLFFIKLGPIFVIEPKTLNVGVEFKQEFVLDSLIDELEVSWPFVFEFGHGHYEGRRTNQLHHWVPIATDL